MSDQALVPTEVCLKHGCHRAKLVEKSGYWVCPQCHASYGKLAKEDLTPSKPPPVGAGGEIADAALLHPNGQPYLPKGGA